MLLISDMIIAHPEVTSCSELEELVRAARQGAIHLNFDMKPEYRTGRGIGGTGSNGVPVDCR